MGNGDGSVRKLHEYVVSGISFQWPVRPSGSTIRRKLANGLSYEIACEETCELSCDEIADNIARDQSHRWLGISINRAFASLNLVRFPRNISFASASEVSPLIPCRPLPVLLSLDSEPCHLTSPLNLALVKVTVLYNT